MALKKTNPAAVINKVVKLYKQWPIYTRAITVHRNHKGVKLDIPHGHFLEQIYKDNSRDLVIRKGTQMGVSEYMVVRALYRAEQGRSVFYVMPTYELKNQFVKDRFDKSILVSGYYQKILNETEGRTVESMSLKQIGNGTIAFVGSNTANAFISFQADDVFIDEFDNCNQQNILMAEERQSASTDKMNIIVGNPSITNFGIDALYKNSCMYQWHIKCEHCGTDIFPDFFKHVMRQIDNANWIVIDREWKHNSDHQARAYCLACSKPFNRFMPGEWIAERPAAKKIGYSISKMFATHNTVNELIQRFSDGLSNEFSMQRFYNGDLGLPYIATGAKIDSSMLDDCIDQAYTLPAMCVTPCIAGIDVGSVFNIIIAEPLEKRIVYIGELPVQDIVEIKDLFRQYSVRLFVIDALPETRIARQIIARNKTGFMNYYSLSKNELTISGKDSIISTNRTVCLDAVKEAIILKEFALPANAKTIPGFYDHMTASTRIYNDDKQTFSWVESGPDHYFHSFALLLLARKLLVMAT